MPVSFDHHAVLTGNVSVKQAVSDGLIRANLCGVGGVVEPDEDAIVCGDGSRFTRDGFCDNGRQIVWHLVLLPSLVHISVLAG